MSYFIRLTLHLLPRLYQSVPIISRTLGEDVEVVSCNHSNHASCLMLSDRGKDHPGPVKRNPVEIPPSQVSDFTLFVPDHASSQGSQNLS
jgi:hypothetical protein